MHKFLLVAASLLPWLPAIAESDAIGAQSQVRAIEPLRLTMGPNPGGRLGEDMPFQGDDVIRRAPAATAERDPAAAQRSDATVRCPDERSSRSDADAERKTDQRCGESKKAPPTDR